MAIHWSRSVPSEKGGIAVPESPHASFAPRRQTLKVRGPSLKNPQEPPALNLNRQSPSFAKFRSIKALYIHIYIYTHMLTPPTTRKNLHFVHLSITVLKQRRRKSKNLKIQKSKTFYIYRVLHFLDFWKFGFLEFGNFRIFNFGILEFETF